MSRGSTKYALKDGFGLKLPRDEPPSPTILYYGTWDFWSSEGFSPDAIDLPLVGREYGGGARGETDNRF